MLEHLKLALLLLQQEADVRTAEYHAAHQRYGAVKEEYEAAYSRMREADRLVEHISDFISGTSTEVPL